MYVPRSYDPARKWPVMLFLHGAGERGNDGRKQLSVGLGPVLKHRDDFPFLVVFPQCEDIDSSYVTAWSPDAPDGRRALAILAHVEQCYSVEPQQRILCGWSMGGYGAWSIASRYPNMWAAVMPISGGGDPDSLGPLAAAKTPVWAIHGELDPLVPSEKSQQMVTALLERGGTAAYTELEGMGHDIGPVVFRNGAVIDWLLDPSGIDATRIDWQPTIAAARARPWEFDEFIPTHVGERVIGIRLGNNAWRTLAEGIPEVIPPEALTGTLADIHRTLGEGEERVDIRLSNVRYECRVSATRITALSGERLRVSFALAPIRLQIDRTMLHGAAVHAEAGPILMELGHRRPVWLDLEVRPEAYEGKVQLTPLRQRFQITDDNWHVVPPGEVTVEKGDFLPEHIVTGLVGGTYLNRAEMEAQVLGVVPALLETIEERIGQIDTSRFTAALWPLPVLAPQLRLRPAVIRTDAAGVSVLLDVLVGTRTLVEDSPAIEPLAAVPLSLGELGASRDLDVLAAIDLIRALSAAAVAGGGARINVLDIPEPRFARLAEPEVIRTILPNVPHELRQFRAVVSLEEPFEMRVGETHANGAELDLVATELRVAFQGRVDSSQSWTRLGAFNLHLRQPLLLSKTAGATGTAGLMVRWKEGAEMAARSIGGAATDSQCRRFESEFRSAWEAWAVAQPQQVTEIADVAAGSAALSWSDVVWNATGSAADSPRVRLQFAAPETRVVNNSQRPVLYEVSGSSSGWSGPYVLPPGETHRYRAGYELKWREFTSKSYSAPVYTIPRGETLTLSRQLQIKVAQEAQ